MPSLQPLPLGVSDWAQIRKDQLFLVDKTKELNDLVSCLTKIFISRPHGMGKTLMLSMLADLFAHGDRNFEGMAIYRHWRERHTYPVIKLDFSQLKGNDVATCEASMQSLITEAYCAVGLTQFLEFEPKPDTFDWFVKKVAFLYREQELVFLIDNWDSALLEHLDQPEAYNAIKQVLATFYRWLRGIDNARFIMVTGLMPFNSLETWAGYDISDLSHDTLCGVDSLLGITSAELEQYYAPYLNTAASRLHLSAAALREQLQDYYGGYCFDTQAQGRLYCPLALNQFLAPLVAADSPAVPEFKSYWMATVGSGASLPHYLKGLKLDLDHDYPQLQADDVPMTKSQLYTSLERDYIKLLPLMLKTGYLTIKEATDAMPTADLRVGYPNRAITQQVLSLVDEYIDQHIATNAVTATTQNLLQALWTEQFDEACRILNQLLDGYIDYSAFDSKWKGFYLTILQRWLQELVTCTLDRSCGEIELSAPNGQGITIALIVISHRDDERYFDLEPQDIDHTLLQLIIAADEQRVFAWRAANPHWDSAQRAGTVPAEICSEEPTAPAPAP